MIAGEDSGISGAVCPKCGELVAGAEPGDVTSCAGPDGTIDRHVVLVAAPGHDGEGDAR